MNRGFTLIELIIVMAIIGICAVIVEGQYNKYVNGGHITDTSSSSKYVLTLTNEEVYQCWKYTVNGAYLSCWGRINKLKVMVSNTSVKSVKEIIEE